MFDLFRFLVGKRKIEAQDLNLLTTLDYYDRLKSIGLALFEWINLPPSCNERFLETTLYEYGRAIFINDSNYGFMNLKCTPSGELNVYNESLKYNAYGTNYNKDFLKNDCVLIRNNYLEKSTDSTIILFATRMTEAERTIDVNIKAQKTPIVFKGTEKERLSLLNLWKEYDGNEPFMVVSKSMETNNFEALKTDAPYVADKVQIYKHGIWDEAMSFYGINNVNTDKRERLIADEANGNNEQILINAQAMLLTRKQACKEINKKWGLNLDVRFRVWDYQEESSENEEMEDAI